MLPDGVPISICVAHQGKGMAISYFREQANPSWGRQFGGRFCA